MHLFFAADAENASHFFQAYASAEQCISDVVDLPFTQNFLSTILVGNKLIIRNPVLEGLLFQGLWLLVCELLHYFALILSKNHNI